MLNFCKYNGLGNHFIIIDLRENSTYKTYSYFDSNWIRNICNQNFGVGADGLIYILPVISTEYCSMRIFNCDGSEAEMCGNGIRCLANYLRKTDNLNPNQTIVIKTLAGNISSTLFHDDLVQVNMGNPILSPPEIPTLLDASVKSLPYGKLYIDNLSYEIYSVGMGNPHLITYVKDLESIEFELLGSRLENNYLFPSGTNVHFVRVITNSLVEVKVWERGVGPTLACGTGACAVVVASCLLGYCSNNTDVQLPGGILNISWEGIENPVFMKGTAKEVYAGRLSNDMAPYCL